MSLTLIILENPTIFAWCRVSSPCCVLQEFDENWTPCHVSSPCHFVRPHLHPTLGGGGGSTRRYGITIKETDRDISCLFHFGNSLKTILVSRTSTNKAHKSIVETFWNIKECMETKLSLRWVDRHAWAVSFSFWPPIQRVPTRDYEYPIFRPPIHHIHSNS